MTEQALGADGATEPGLAPGAPPKAAPETAPAPAPEHEVLPASAEADAHAHDGAVAVAAADLLATAESPDTTGGRASAANASGPSGGDR